MALADARPAAILAPAPDALVLAVAPHRRIALAPRGARKSLPLDARRPRARDPAGHVRDDRVASQAGRVQMLGEVDPIEDGQAEVAAQRPRGRELIKVAYMFKLKCSASSGSRPVAPGRSPSLLSQRVGHVLL
jgi:hypothetical protein